MATTDLSDLMYQPGDASYYTDSFRNAIEDNLEGLINSPGNTYKTADPDMGLANKYDFFSLLIDLSVPPQYHFVVMRMNGLGSPMDYDGTLLEILIPPFSRIEQIRTLQQTSTIITS